MTSTFSPQDLVGTEAVDPSGDKIGKVGTVYVTDDGRRPEWVTVKTGMFGNKESFVPLAGAQTAKDGLHVKPTKDAVKGAPQIASDGHLDQRETDELYRYYGIRPDGQPSDNRGEAPGGQAAGAGTGAAAGTAGATGAAAGTAAATTGRHEHAGMESGSNTGRAPGDSDPQRQRTGERHDADAGSGQDMIRSEERMTAGTEQVESGRVRLHKYVVTEEQNITVPVSHEEVRVEREPISESDRERVRSTGISEEEQEVVLHEERPVVQKETVPVEKVHLDTETVTEEQTVSGELHKERVEVDDGTEHRRHSGER